jgi:NAD+-dependent protein deacetylase sirtuin 6
LTLNFSDGCSCLSSSIGWPVDFQVISYSILSHFSLAIVDIAIIMYDLP